MDAVPRPTERHGWPPVRPVREIQGVMVVLLWLTFCYLWILPFFVPRGAYLWGHYQLRDLLLGLPVGLATLCFTMVRLSPTQTRHGLALRLVTVCIALI